MASNTSSIIYDLDFGKLREKVKRFLNSSTLTSFVIKMRFLNYSNFLISTKVSYIALNLIQNYYYMNHTKKLVL